MTEPDDILELTELRHEVAELKAAHTAMMNRLIDMTKLLMATPPSCEGRDHTLTAATVRARNIELVDVDGHTRIKLTAGYTDGPEIAIRDEYGMSVMLAGHHDGFHKDLGDTTVGLKPDDLRGKTFLRVAEHACTGPVIPEYSLGQLDGTLCAQCGRATPDMRPLTPPHRQRPEVNRLDSLVVCNPRCPEQASA
jgi:hypothetical protein